MGLLGVVLIIVGIPLALGGWIVLLKLAFQESFLTGVGCFFIPFILLFFALFRLRDTKNALAAYVVGFIFLVLGGSCFEG